MGVEQCLAVAVLVVTATAGVRAVVLYQDNFDKDSLAVYIHGVGGGAVNHTVESHAWRDERQKFIQLLILKA
ncbi:hypothetical protein P4C99_06450 [Pontiellaceae bacterium B1224]|nr:hypothetical protein [Pontiellaceae bacterium B1224]